MNPPHFARYYSHLKDGRLQCELCPRLCALKEGQRGFCFVRQNVGGRMVLTTYGYSSGFCVDPIEKKPLNHFYPGSSVLSFGTAGCNLGCQFCQNWSISKARVFDALTDEASPEDIARCAQRLACRSVAFTYNDPVIFAEYAIDVAKACHALGIKTVAVTAGYICKEARPDFFEHMDAANVDLKAFSEDFYRKVTLSSLQPVLETLCYLRHRTSVFFEITNLLIPGKNDDAAEIQAMCAWIVSNLGVEVPLHFTAFHPDYRFQKYPPTPLSTLIRARDMALGAGLRYVYLGNVRTVQGESHTYCHECGQVLIERQGYEVGAYHVNAQNQCGFCGAHCVGVFEDQPGWWGARRLPVRIYDR